MKQKRIYFFILTLLIALLSSKAIYALNNNVGNAGMQVLKIGIGARSAAMAGAYSAVADDATSIYHNPAGLREIECAEISVQHLIYFEDIQYANLSLAKTFNFGTLGFSFSYLWMDELDGLETEYDTVRKFKADNSVVTLAYSNQFKKYSYGAALKVISTNIDETDALGIATDIAIKRRLFDKLKLVLVLQNLGPDYKFDGNDTGEVGEKLPRNIKTGIAYFTDNINIALDLNMPNDNDVNFNFGVEYIIVINNVIIPIRAGYKSLNSFDLIDGLSAGLGLTYNKITVDFAWSPYGELGDTYMASVLFKL
ncbi:PorV/PorQ family protein [Elusimicrobiota bacterium]